MVEMRWDAYMGGTPSLESMCNVMVTRRDAENDMTDGLRD